MKIKEPLTEQEEEMFEKFEQYLEEKYRKKPE